MASKVQVRVWTVPLARPLLDHRANLVQGVLVKSLLGAQAISRAVLLGRHCHDQQQVAVKEQPRAQVASNTQEHRNSTE